MTEISNEIDIQNRVRFQDIINRLCPGKKDETSSDRYITALIHSSQCYKCCDQELCHSPNTSLSYCINSLLNCRRGKTIVNPMDIINTAKLSTEQVLCLIHDPCINVAYMLLSGPKDQFVTTINQFAKEISNNKNNFGFDTKTLDDVRRAIVDEKKIDKKLFQGITHFAKGCSDIMADKIRSVRNAWIQECFKALGSYVLIPLIVGRSPFIIVKFIKPAAKSWLNLGPAIVKNMILPAGAGAFPGIACLVAWFASIVTFGPATFQLFFDTFLLKKYQTTLKKAYEDFYESDLTLDSIVTFSAFKDALDYGTALIYHNPAFYLSQAGILGLAKSVGLTIPDALLIQNSVHELKGDTKEKNFLSDDLQCQPCDRYIQIPSLLYDHMASNLEEYREIMAFVLKNGFSLARIGSHLNQNIQDIRSKAYVAKILSHFKESVKGITSLFWINMQDGKDFETSLKSVVKSDVDIEKLAHEVIDKTLNAEYIDGIGNTLLGQGAQVLAFKERAVDNYNLAVDYLEKARKAKQALANPANALFEQLPSETRNMFLQAAGAQLPAPREMNVEKMQELLASGQSFGDILRKHPEYKPEVMVAPNQPLQLGNGIGSGLLRNRIEDETDELWLSEKNVQTLLSVKF